MQCWLAFHFKRLCIFGPKGAIQIRDYYYYYYYTLHGACNRWWTPPLARLCIIKVRPHHAAPTPVTLAESSMADRLQAAILVYKCLHGLAPAYLADELKHTAESEFRRRLCSASSHHELSVPDTRLSTYGDWDFPVAAVRIWNSLPQHITSAPSLPVFCSCLKTYFFELCYP